MDRLDLPSSFSTAVTLIEWANKLQHLPDNRLNVHISLVTEELQVHTACQQTRFAVLARGNPSACIGQVAIRKDGAADTEHE